MFRLIKKLFVSGVFAALALFLSGCGASGGNIHMKSAGAGEKDIAQRSGFTFAVTKSFTDINGTITTAPSYRVYVANYDLDSSFFAKTLNKPLTADDQVLVAFSLVGEEGGNEKTAAKTGSYSAKADKFMKVEDVSITTRRGSADNKEVLNRSNLNGEVSISSISGDTITGTIDLTSGDMSVKGPFTAKILIRK